ncbi:MAG: hypothetical protein BWY85_00074 [Firmicutes bacterium ADurb.Bin506]|nr:MAG: hypothetical protein BWY85_00074 [Firmicutes bacterium ADurb.Bin506]
MLLLIEARPVPAHMQRSQSAVDSAVDAYRSKRPDVKPSKIFVKHHPHRGETTIRVPTEHARRLARHLGKAGVSSAVLPRPGTKNYKTVSIQHDAAEIAPHAERKPTAGDRLSWLHRHVVRAITRSVSSGASVFHNLRRTVAGQTECVPDEVFDLVERLCAIEEGESMRSLKGPWGMADVKAAVAAYTGKRIEGGKGDKTDPSKFPLATLLFGMNVEQEHTDCPNKALEITIDHLTENPEYYKILDDAGLVDESDRFGDSTDVSPGENDDGLLHLGGGKFQAWFSKAGHRRTAEAAADRVRRTVPTARVVVGGDDSESHVLVHDPANAVALGNIHFMDL